MLLSSTDTAGKRPAALRQLSERLAGIPANDPMSSVSAIRETLDACLAPELEFSLAAESLSELDELAQPFIRTMFRGFLQAVALKSERGEVLRAASVGFFTDFSSACAGLLTRGRYEQDDQGGALALLATRLIRAESNRLKWDHLVYGPFDPQLWLRTGAVLLEAVEEGRHGVVVQLRSGRDTSTSSQREMTRAVALHCAGLDQLSPDLIDVADRLIHYILPALHVAPNPIEGARFFWVPGDGTAPSRIVRSQAVPGAWYFSAQHADAAMLELETMLGKGVVPGALDGGPGSRERLTAATRHLRRAWCDAPVKRRYRRHPMTGEVKAVKGLHAFQQALKDGGESAESWAMTDASVGGMGLTAPVSRAQMPAIGELVAVRPEDSAEWRLGMVRRLNRLEAPDTFLGLETFATAPRLVRADDGRAPVDVLLCDPIRRGGILRVIAPVNTLRPGTPLFVAENGAIQKLKPLGSNWRGNEFEVRTYLVL